MATSPQARQDPNIQHRFDGDVKVLNGTVETRTALRKAISAFQQSIQNIDNSPVQLSADFMIRIGGPDAKQHTYTVTATSSGFDAESFPERIASAAAHAQAATPKASNGTPLGPNSTNGQQLSHAHATPGSRSRKVGDDDDDDIIEIRPFKRPKTKGSSHSPAQSQSQPSNELSSAANEDDMFHFLKTWHTEWKHQGGWLFDNITKLGAAATTTQSSLDQRMGVVQDVIGQSINTSSLSTMNELANISRLVPWLESCRKSSADNQQARAEKWRTSSASFHDQARREREAAEQRIEKKLAEQKELLLKLAKANGLGVDELEGDGEGEGEARVTSREESLGAQLTAELNTEAEKS
ncbi:hypothetical protein LTR09_002998 [Extremus antarcticus]|uniref:Uncharacterized protein n=1 Tax=Extremus antarcticus TaxID=702011 RepID=A0AAJ0GE42_9PEZI|nr:hypothetical protein LTR09_002998 [Extremus antarcticus]